MLVDQNPSYRQITKDDYEAMAGPSWPDFEIFSAGSKIEKFIADELDLMLSEIAQKRQNLSNFCVLPFFAKEYPVDTHCCLLPRNYDIDRIRSDMLNNIRTPYCQKCWVLEDAGRLSDRQIKNLTLETIDDTDLSNLYDLAASGNYTTTHYKIEASNYCNATCVTCSNGSSTAWGDLEKKNPQLVEEFYSQDKKSRKLYLLKQQDEKILIDYSTAKFVSFSGGESTMIRTHWDIVEKIADTGNKECRISFVTNGSFNLTSRQRDLLRNFKHVDFCFSIDGISKVFEYMRFPLCWQSVSDNVKWAQDQGFIVNASYTVSNLNILYHEQTVGWFQDNNIPYIENLVYDPEHFAPRSLSHDVKQKILGRTNNDMIKLLLSTHTDDDSKKYQEFLKHISYQDSLKKIRISDYLPEFVSMI